jgi:5-(carboxyamino)imidazole ribonucleotide mutase
MPEIAIVMGSDSDWRIMEQAQKIVIEFGLEVEVEVLSAHRTPEKMLTWAKNASSSGVKVIIAGAGGAAHLPGMVASITSLPVIGVPVSLGNLEGMDSLLSIVQMPAGVPVATVSIDGAKNAGLLALRILSIANPDLGEKLDAYRVAMAEQVEEKNVNLKKSL